MENYIAIYPHRTAIFRKDISKPYKLLLNEGLDQRTKILDYGCGHALDVDFMQNLSFDIKGFDLYMRQYRDFDLLNGKYDLVTCNYVFNVIPNKEERVELLKTLRSLGDKVLISVRADKKAIKESWLPYKDGYITPKKTFQKFYTREEVLEFFGDVVFLSDTSSEKIFYLK